MNTTPTYAFRGERIEALLRQAATAVTADDLEGRWDDLFTDASDSAYLFSAEQLVWGAEEIAALPPFDPRHGAGHPAAFERLARHDNCEQVIGDLTAQRNDVIASILAARDYCFNDIYPGEFGDLYLTAENVLHQLRPSLPDRGRYVRLDVLMDECPECYQQTFDHEDGCEFEERAEDAERRREHAIASHLHCTAMGQWLVDHMMRCLDRAEVIAHRIRTTTREASGGDMVVDPHEVLEVIHVGDLNVPTEPLTATALLTAVHPPLEDVPYCNEAEGHHHAPHRACRFLVC